MGNTVWMPKDAQRKWKKITRRKRLQENEKENKAVFERRGHSSGYWGYLFS